MIRAGIIGASGYAGGELVRLLLGHKKVAVVSLASSSNAGKAAFEVYPSLRGYDLPRFSGISPEELARDCDVVFAATPPGAAIPLIQGILAGSASTRVVDIGSDLRLKDRSLYQEWYGMAHNAPELLSASVYGLPELHRDEMQSARIVANPGCYPTAAVLALAPLVSTDLVDLRSIVIDAKSGVSGAGRSPSLGYHFPECSDNARPYGVPRHRHIPEIEQELQRLARRAGNEETVVVGFTPHLIPMSRGILVTAYASLKRAPGAAGGDVDTAAVTRIYEDFYAGERFVRVLRGDLPQTKAVCGSNFCDIAVRADARTGRVVAMSALDNLVKGAAGQAVQNMNIMFGEDESLGLEAAPLWP